MIESHLTIDMNPSIYAEMSQLSAKHKAVDMAQGVADFPIPEWLVDQLYYYAKKGRNTYSPIPGTPQLRQACAKKIEQAYDVAVDTDQVLITCGASEGILATMLAFVNAGDEVIYFDPAFDIYPNAVTLAGGISRRLRLKDNGHIDLAAIERSITDKTRAILLNSPHNPVGSIITRDEYEQLAKLVKDKNILILSDEVYEHITAAGTFTSALQIKSLRKQLVVFQSFGKTYHLTGWRLGACVAPKALTKPIQAVKQNMSFSAPTPMQLSVADGINNHPEFWQEQPKLYQQKYQHFASQMQQSRFKLCRWEGSPFLLLDYTEIEDIEDTSIAFKLIKDHGIGLVPISSSYESPQHGFLRLCFAKSDDKLDQAASILSKI